MKASAQLAFPVVARLQLVAVEEYIHTRLLESDLELLHGRPVAAGIAQEYRSGFDFRSGRDSIVLRRVLQGRIRVFFRPALMQFVDEVNRAALAKNLGAAAEPFEKKNQTFVMTDRIVRDIVRLVIGGEALAFRHAHQKTGQPSGEASA